MSILVTTHYPESAVNGLRIQSSLIRNCFVNSFDYSYEDKETILLLEGEVTVIPKEGQPVILMFVTSSFLAR